MPSGAVRTLDELATPRSVIGIGIAMTDAEHFQLHAGLVHRGQKRPPEVLHLGWHAWLTSDPLPHKRHHFVWLEVPLDDDRVDTVVAKCRLIEKASCGRFPSSPLHYAVLYDGARFSNGALQLGPKGRGLTCATFVLAVLKEEFGIDLLKLSTWPPRPAEDARWHARIVAGLEDLRANSPERITQEHVDHVRQESGCVRFRPEEVAAGASLFDPSAQASVSFAETQPIARAILSGFLSAAVYDGFVTALETCILGPP